MKRISSISTLILVLFIPVFWFVLFLSIGLGILLTDADEFSFMNPGLFRGIYWLVFIFFGVLIYFTLLRLKRVELDEEYVYITNYFKTIRIPLKEVHSIRSKSLLFRHLVRMELHYKSYFGRYIYFISDAEHIEYFQQKIFQE